MTQITHKNGFLVSRDGYVTPAVIDVRNGLPWRRAYQGSTPYLNEHDARLGAIKKIDKKLTALKKKRDEHARWLSDNASNSSDTATSG